MQKVKLMTDSACDIPKEKEEELSIRILPFHIMVDDVEYLERIDFDHFAFYDILKTCKKIPTTSMITQPVFIEEYERFYNEGFSDLIYVAINSKGSNTYIASKMARDVFYGKHPEAKGKYNIHIIDSRTYTMLYGYAVVEGAAKAKRGAGVDEILGCIHDWLDNAEVYFAPYSLEFAKKSGRVSAAAAFLGEMIGLKPIMSFPDGDSKVVSKVRGDNAVIPEILRISKDRIIPKTPYLVIMGSIKERNEEMLREAEKLFGYPPAYAFYIGAAIAINSGPNITGIVVKGKS